MSGSASACRHASDWLLVRELVKESYGYELLQSIGKVYINKSEQHQASSQFAPLGWFHGAKQNFNLIGDT